MKTEIPNPARHPLYKRIAWNGKNLDQYLAARDGQGDDAVSFLTRRRVTICGITLHVRSGRTMYSTGVAMRNPIDPEDRKLGRLVALNDALDAAAARLGIKIRFKQNMDLQGAVDEALTKIKVVHTRKGPRVTKVKKVTQ